MTEDKVRELLGDGNIVRPVTELLEGGYNLEEIKHVFIQLSMRILKEEK
jgi:hypothetical protein